MWALVVEFQSKPDPEMNGRLLEYVARLRLGLRHGRGRRGRYQVAAALVNLTGKAQPDHLTMELPGSETPGLEFRVALKALREEDAPATLAGIAEGRVAACLLPWISLMKGAGDPTIIETWKEVASRKVPERRRTD